MQPNPEFRFQQPAVEDPKHFRGARGLMIDAHIIMRNGSLSIHSATPNRKISRSEARSHFGYIDPAMVAAKQTFGFGADLSPDLSCLCQLVALLMPRDNPFYPPRLAKFNPVASQGFNIHTVHAILVISAPAVDGGDGKDGKLF